MSPLRGFDASEPPRPQRAGHLGGPQEERRARRPGRLATATLACPDCDAPISPGGRRLTPSTPLSCPWCGVEGHGRDFLSLSSPARPARVVVTVVETARAAAR